MKISIKIVFYFFIMACRLSKAEPITLSVVGAGALSAGALSLGSMIYNYKSVQCFIAECCEEGQKWLAKNISKLEDDFKNKLFGQHLVEVALLRHIKAHVFNDNPAKALVLSFNGVPGTGKNYVSRMIVESLYKKGMDSKYVHFFIASVHFPLDENVNQYKLQLQKDITSAVRNCPRSIFIFDEVHDMPPTLLDAIKPFVDSYENIDGISYRKSIFILLSNSGSMDINTTVLKAFKDHRARESVTLAEIESALADNIYELKNDGLRKSKLIQHGLITAFIPFLPLEKRHVKLCIKALLKLKLLENDNDLVEKVLRNLKFEDYYGLELANQGCKRIEEQLYMFL